MKPFSLLFLVCCLSITVLAKEFTVSGRFSGLNGREVDVVLKEAFMGRFSEIDTVKTVNGLFKFTLSDPEAGFYKVEWTIRRTEDVVFVVGVVDSEVRLNIDLANFNPYEAVDLASTENRALRIAKGIEGERRRTISQLKEIYRDISKINPQYYSKKRDFRDSVEVVKARFNKELIRLRDEFKDTYVSKFFIPLILKPTLKDNPDIEESFDGFTSLLHHHFFDYAQLEDPSVLRCPELTNQVQDYLNEFAGSTLDDDTEAVTYLLSRSANHDVRSLLIQLCYVFYVAKEETQILDFIESRYFSELEPDVSASLQKRYDKLDEVALGKPFKNFPFYACDCDETDLNEVVKNNQITLLVFWDYDCGACQKELEELTLLHKEFNTRGLEIVAISVNDDENRWHAEIQARNYQWINLIEPSGLAGPAPKLYSVQQTPTSYLILNNGMLKGHNESPAQLKRIMQAVLK